MKTEDSPFKELHLLMLPDVGRTQRKRIKISLTGFSF